MLSKSLMLAPMVVLLLLLTADRPSYSKPSGTCLVSTVYGDVQGANLGLSCAFLSVPYGASTAGANRWRPPQPRAPWAPVVLDASVQGTSCPLLQGTTPAGSEDCLRLNIWVSNPAPAAPAPVIVWLHTGGFTAASSNFGGSNGSRLAGETGVIVVTPNYRLGALGFLAHPALEAEDSSHPSTGNYGLLDQRAALQWVHDNIAQFGGDPGNVTIAGTSAGGQSVGLHLVSPGSWGLFQRAAIQSAYPTSAWSTKAEAFGQGNAFATQLGCVDPATVLTCLRATTRDQVLNALALGPQAILETTGRAYWEPIVDGIVVPAQPRLLFEQGEFVPVPTLIGANRDEGWGQFIRRSFPTGVTLAQYEQWVANEFGASAAQILSAYPAADFASPEEALARVLGDGQFTCETRRLADLIADGGLRGRGPHETHDTGQRRKSPVFLYSYEYELDDISLDHVIHGLESNIIFGNNYTPAGSITVPHVLTATDLLLHAQMAGYWTRFAAVGDPNGALVSWPVYRKNHEEHIVFDTSIAADANLGNGVCALWSGFFFRSFLTGMPASQ